VGEVLVELGISTGAGIKTDLGMRRADATQRAMTEHILGVADQAGYGAALIDAVAEPAVITWPQFAHTVRMAARGLCRRGLREADTVGILVHDAVSHVVAVHAVRAAGAIAVPIRPSQAAADIAAQLKQRQARLLITSAPLAELAVQAAERSWVRQVFAFGEAEGTTPFGSLLHTARHGQPQVNGSTSHNGDTSHNGSTSHNGHNGRDAGHLAAQVLDLADLWPDGLGLQLTHRDVVVAAPPSGDPDAYTSLLDVALAAGATIVAAPLPQVPAAVGVYKGTVAIVPGETDVPGLPAQRVLTVE
jgi:AMP-binding enzyme